jgi:2-amino-4-hydroxy-6-hydroxymethyldihydropteridine diphosphokinase
MSRDKGVLAYLGLGSNLDDPESQLELAVSAIDRLPGTRVLRRSRTYVSKPWGKLDQPDFLNMVVEARTTLSPQALLRHVKEIEKEQGRIDAERWGPRQLDIDILFFGKRRVTTPSLVIPHPRIWQRAFVLRPLADLMPDLTSPNGLPIKEILSSHDIAAQGIWPYESARKSGIV